MTVHSGTRSVPPTIHRSLSWFSLLLPLGLLAFGTPAQARDDLIPEPGYAGIESHTPAQPQPTLDTQRAQVWQAGVHNDATIRQSGQGNLAYVSQNGLDNLMWVQQSGSFNVLYASQDGRGNQLDVTQAGSMNAAFAQQNGQYNQLSIAQNGTGGKVSVTQNGNNMHASVQQF